jgi:GLPGLI family protein
MKHTILLLSLFFNIAISQTIEVNYELLQEKYEVEKTNQELSESLQVLNNTKQFFLLTANKEGSLFITNNQPKNEAEKSLFEIQQILAGIETFYYNAISKELFLVTENVLVLKNNKQIWNLTNESKIINNYKCYKATYEWEITNRHGKKVLRKAVAWYCPELSYNYGPNGFQDLPGLILELEVNNNKLVAKKITLNNQKIQFPVKKSISESEYLKKLRENSEF